MVHPKYDVGRRTIQRVFATSRRPVYFGEFMYKRKILMYKKVAKSIFRFVQNGEGEDVLFNMECYTEKHKLGWHKKPDNRDGYASDEETRKNKKTEYDLSEVDRTFSRITTDFLFDMDTVISTLSLYWVRRSHESTILTRTD